ncbi:toxin-activating lysine-acyltransferase [Rahnella aceris]
MNFPKLDFIAPAFTGLPVDESSVLGNVVWLWMHSSLHAKTPVIALKDVLLPAIKHSQFVLATENGKPVFYLSWATFSARAEARYIKNDVMHLDADEWHSGDRLWFIDWVAPFGHTRQMSLWLRQRFHRQCVRTLHHSNPRTRQFWGLAVTPEEARTWFAAHPLSHSVKIFQENVNE